MNFLKNLFFFAIFYLTIFFDSIACSKNYSYVVFEEKTAEILNSYNSQNIIYPASLVKLMTIYLVFEALESDKLKADKLLKVSERGEEISKVNKSNTLHLKEGNTLTVRQAIHGAIVKSFNEAALTLAEAVANNEWDFVRLMNNKAQELGMINTSFSNATGLHEEGQYTTVTDLARLVLALRKNFSDYNHIFAEKNFSFNGAKYDSTNHVLLEYQGADGMKTGFTNAAGFNLIASAIRDNKRVISVLTGCSSYQARDRLTKELFDDGFKKISIDYKSKIQTRISQKFNY